MFIINRTIPFIGPIFIWMLWENVFIRPKLFLVFALIISIILFFSFWQLFGRSVKFISFSAGRGKEFWQFFGLSFLFFLSSFLFCVSFLPSGLFRHFFVLLVTFLFYSVLENVFNFLYRIDVYQPHSLESLFNYLNLLIFFFLSLNFYGLIFFLNMSFWLLLFVFFLAVLLLSFYYFWANKILNRENMLHIFIITLILTEFFWAVSFLPTNFYVDSLLLLLIYYLMTIMSKYYILKILNKKLIKQHLIVAGAALLLILLTARWR